MQTNRAEENVGIPLRETCMFTSTIDERRRKRALVRRNQREKGMHPGCLADTSTHNTRRMKGGWGKGGEEGNNAPVYRNPEIDNLILCGRAVVYGRCVTIRVVRTRLVTCGGDEIMARSVLLEGAGLPQWWRSVAKSPRTRETKRATSNTMVTLSMWLLSSSHQIWNLSN